MCSKTIKLKIIFASLIIILLIGTNIAQSLDMGSSGIPLSRRYRMIKKAAEISDKAMEAAYQTLKRVFKENITEAHVIAAIQKSIIENGSNPSDPEAPAFYPIVAAGNDSAKPHGFFEDDLYHIIKPGDVVVVDFGARYKGYVSDLTRTFFIGEPTEFQKKIYNITLEAQQKTIDKIRSFIPYVRLEKTARRIISSYGYEEFKFFPHAVSHGIGLNVHGYFPKISWIGYPLSYLPLLPGMVIAVEPGIYIEEAGFGVRIEDDVAVRLFGCEILSHYPKELKDVIIHCDVPKFFDKVNIKIEPTNILELDSKGITNCLITVYNPSDMSIGVNVTIDNVPKGWSVDLIPDILVAAGSETWKNLTIKAPQDFDGVETIDLTFSYYVSADPFIKGTPSTTPIKVKSKKEVTPQFEYGPVVAFLIVLLIIVVAILLWRRKRLEQ
ncbi:MAG: M24 family metallopeptidase [Candidatus Thermoplasmatota archaeon]|jgi:methionine aminopeptidase|nr:M24 family metallopeptidase [Candidatus Thermoplasmatota archaeon]